MYLRKIRWFDLHFTTFYLTFRVSMNMWVESLKLNYNHFLTFDSAQRYTCVSSDNGVQKVAIGTSKLNKINLSSLGAGST